MFGSKLVCHQLAEETVSQFSPVDLTFETRELHLGAIEVIPTPGHTPGSTCFLYESPHGKTYLLAGDMLFPSRGSWEALVWEDGNEAELRQSLALLRGLEPDVVLCGASVGDVPFREMSPPRVARGAGPSRPLVIPSRVLRRRAFSSPPWVWLGDSLPSFLTLDSGRCQLGGNSSRGAARTVQSQTIEAQGALPRGKQHIEFLRLSP
jgi:glyoxylase-like metal-dependent hydrolase (beta-lactamase superfamily II)